MNLDDYPKLKASGRANLMKINKSFAIAVQTALPTGEDGQLEMQAIGREDIARLRDRLNNSIASLDAIELEMNQLDAGTV